MADNVAITAGSGTSIATDDCGAGGHAQITKLAISTDGSATLIPAEATNGLDVDVTRVIPGTSATHLGKAEDAAHASGDTGVMALAVQRDTASSVAADGDYHPLILDSSGRLHVNVGNTLTVGSHAVTNAGTFATQIDGAALTALQLIDNGVFATGTVAGTTDGGYNSLAVRKDTAAVAAGVADGDYTPLCVDSTGKLHVNVGNTVTVGSHAVTNAGTFAVQVDGAALTSLQLIDDVIYADNAVIGKGALVMGSIGGTGNTQAVSVASDGKLDVTFSNTTIAATNAGTFVVQENGAALTALQLIDNSIFATGTVAGITDGGNNVLAVRKDTAAALSGVADGDYTPLSTNSTGMLWVAQSASTVGGGTSLPAGTNNIGDVDVLTLPALPAGSNNIGDVDVLTLPALPAGTNAIGKLAANSGVDIGDVDVTSLPADPMGVNADAASATGSISAKLRFIASTGIPVTSVPSHAVTNAGTFAVQVDGSALTALQLIDDSIFADDAAFTVATSKVSVSGGVAVAHGTNPDAADALDAVAYITNRHRVPFFIGGHPNIVTLKHTTITTAVTDAAIITVSGGTKIVVTGITATLDNASSVFPTLLIGFGATNTPTTTGVIMSHGGVPAGGGVNRGDGSGIIGIGADGEDLRVTTTGNATGNGLQIVVTYYTIES